MDYGITCGDDWRSVRQAHTAVQFEIVQSKYGYDVIAVAPIGDVNIAIFDTYEDAEEFMDALTEFVNDWKPQKMNCAKIIGAVEKETTTMLDFDKIVSQTQGSIREVDCRTQEIANGIADAFNDWKYDHKNIDSAEIEKELADIVWRLLKSGNEVISCISELHRLCDEVNANVAAE